MLKGLPPGSLPARLLQSAFRIKVEDGQASEETDKRLILNSSRQRPTSDCINNLLHRHYALGGIVSVVTVGGEALEQCIAALRASPPTYWFVYSAPIDNATAEPLIDLLPPTLQHLELADGAGQARRLKCPRHSASSLHYASSTSITAISSPTLFGRQPKKTCTRSTSLPARTLVPSRPESVGILIELHESTAVPV
jgi:hypothetical protein